MKHPSPCRQECQATGALTGRCSWRLAAHGALWRSGRGSVRESVSAYRRHAQGWSAVYMPVEGMCAKTAACPSPYRLMWRKNFVGTPEAGPRTPRTGSTNTVLSGFCTLALVSAGVEG